MKRIIVSQNSYYFFTYEINILIGKNEGILPNYITHKIVNKTNKSICC